MSGHSKWATTKHRKGAQDAKRSALFSKLSRNITVAARLCRVFSAVHRVERALGAWIMCHKYEVTACRFLHVFAQQFFLLRFKVQFLRKGSFVDRKSTRLNSSH